MSIHRYGHCMGIDEHSYITDTTLQLHMHGLQDRSQNSRRRHRRPGRAHRPRSTLFRLTPFSKLPSTVWKQVRNLSGDAVKRCQLHRGLHIISGRLHANEARTANLNYNVRCAGHSVLVSAHTSAGKTVVAEYAFAMALR